MDLPKDIVVDILRRMPVKSLVQFRCVSKSWRSLISDPAFVRTHISSGTASRILLSSSRYAGTLLSLKHHHENGDDDVGFAVAEEHDLDLVKNSNYYVKGQCDGLLCLLIYNEEKSLLVVYNPSIREHRILPLPPNFHSPMEPFGIGYDPSVDDYKIVVLPPPSCTCKHHPGYVPQVQIFALKSKSNSWRSLPHQHTPPYFVHHAFQTTNANGGLYWIVGEKDAYTTVILRFDLVEEKFRVIPPVPDESLWSVTWLGSLRDSLCVINSREAIASHFHVWSTKDDKTWTKLITIPTLQVPYSYLFNPLCYTKAGALLMRLRGLNGFVMFEPEENKFRQFAVSGVEHHLEEIVYCESLVSPNCGNEDEEDSGHR